MKLYRIIKAKENEIISGTIWLKSPKAEIDVYPWGGEYRPKAEAQLVYTDEAFYIKLYAIEVKENIRIQEHGLTKNVYQDSCLEFFFMPNPDTDKRYINFEFNSEGAIYIGIGTERCDKRLLSDQDVSVFNITPFINAKENEIIEWGIHAKVPFAFIKEHNFNVNYHTGSRISGNFYKCGDLTPKPHYGVWNPIDWPYPDFHRPEFFGDMFLL